jgi:hypothetical protein
MAGKLPITRAGRRCNVTKSIPPLRRRSDAADGGVGVGIKRIAPPGDPGLKPGSPPSPSRGGKKIYVDGRDPRVVARGQAKPGHDERN